jgi:tetratricopeptide (TPR) repeat protein
VRQSVAAHLARLAEIAAHPDPDLAADAAKFLGSLYYLLDDGAQAERWSRKSVALVPADDVARKLLTGALMCNDHGDEAIRLLREWLKQQDSASYRFLLALCYDELGKKEQVEETLAAGLKAFPDDFLLNLSRAGCLLRKGDPVSLTAAGELLDRLRDQVGRGPSDENRKENYDRARIAYTGLTGDEAAAREAVKRLRQ